MDHREGAAAEKQIVSVAEAAAKIDPCHLMDHLVKALVSAIWISIGKKKNQKNSILLVCFVNRERFGVRRSGCRGIRITSQRHSREYRSHG